MKTFLIGLFIGFILGIVLAVLIMKDRSAPAKEIKITQLSGEKIEHDKFKLTKSSFLFNTKAQGKGEIQTEIPKKIIPEAKSWIEKVNAIQINIFLDYYENDFHKKYDILYWRRFGQFSIGGGIVFSEDSLGISTGVQYWF